MTEPENTYEEKDKPKWLEFRLPRLRWLLLLWLIMLTCAAVVNGIPTLNMPAYFVIGVIGVVCLVIIVRNIPAMGYLLYEEAKREVARNEK